MPKPQESVWGSINTCAEIGMEIFRIVCKNNKGEMKTGITIPIDRAKEVLSEKALSLGAERDGYISYEGPDKSLVPLFELMKSGAVTDLHLTHRFRDVGEIERNGKAAVPEYFGSLPLPPPIFPNDDILSPHRPPDADDRTVTEIRSGLSIIKDTEHHFFVAVHETLALRNLTLDARRYGDENGGFYYYGAISCAIPLHELSHKHPEINDVVLNRDSLEQTMVTKTPNYVAYWNGDFAKPGKEIRPNGSIPMMFLQEHLDCAAESTRSEVAAFQAVHAHEADRGNGFNEDVLELER